MGFRRRSGAKAEDRVLHQEVVTVDGPGRRETQVLVQGTDTAVHFLGRYLRVSHTYDSIAYVTSVRKEPFEADRLELVDNDFTRLVFGFPRKDQGLGEFLEDRLAGLERVDYQDEIYGHVVTASYHPWQRDVMSYWAFSGVPPSVDASWEPEIGRLMMAAKNEVLARYSPGRSATPYARATDWIERDWNEAMAALCGHVGVVPPVMWSAGHAVDRDSETPVIVGVAETDIYLATFETLRPPPQARRAPEMVIHRIQNWADWDLRPEANGSLLLRLLEVHGSALGLQSLEEVLRTPGAFGIRLIGLADPSKATLVSDAIVKRIRLYGAYSPASRTNHPLQSPE